jgi:hypothetical protein
MTCTVLHYLTWLSVTTNGLITSCACSSGKCQIIDWRSGHKEICQLLSQSTAAESRPKSPIQMMSPSSAAAPRPKSPKKIHHLISFKSVTFGSGTDKCGMQEGATTHDQFGIQTKNSSIDISRKGKISILKETKLKGEDGANGKSSHSNNSSEFSVIEVRSI